MLCVLAVLQICAAGALARLRTPTEARNVVIGWLRLDSQPLGAALGTQVREVVSYPAGGEQAVYYIVYLEKGGFVIMPADDMVEPIIGFVEKGIYDPSHDNPLGALVSFDLASRVSAARQIQAMEASSTTLESQKMLEAQDKWEQLTGLGEGGPVVMGIPSVSDPRVDPLVKTKWGQTLAGTNACYNYYTPLSDPCDPCDYLTDSCSPGTPNPYGDHNNYPCGCVATAMAQLMRFHKHPTEAVDKEPWHWITVGGGAQKAWKRGSDGNGARYQWDMMDFEPNCSTTEPNHLQAIGALCYDAGVSVYMNYSAGGSSASTRDATFALRDLNFFDYNNAVYGFNNAGNIGPGLNGMINPNLDYNHPVILSIAGPNDTGGDYESRGHAVVCDGYGYNQGTLYHHLNMGWQGLHDAWYNLPNITGLSFNYNCVYACVYNVFITGGGEIISGRVADELGGSPISGAKVTAVESGGGVYQAFTNNRGIYALAHLPSASTYTITVTKFGYSFTPAMRSTGLSNDWNSVSGNVWPVDFNAVSICYVDMNAPGDNNGSSWDNAYNYLQDALADPCAQVIWVADGTYYPDSNSADPNGSGSRDASFVLKNSVAIYGGFAGYGAPDPNTRDIKLYETILSGDLKGNDHQLADPCDLLSDPCRAENSYHVVTGSNTDVTAILDGFTITAGNADSGGWPNSYGGGMFNLNANCTVNKCTFIENSTAGSGGAMWNYQSNLQVINCIFFRNATKDGGGGILNDSASCPTLVNCSFISNEGFGAGNNGGGLYNIHQSNPAVTNCLFCNNSAQYGGAVSNITGSCPTIVNCTFSDNLATGGCGGINDYNNSNPTIANCILWGNTAPQISDFCSCTATVYDSDVQGGWGGAGGNNINTDPRFADTNGPDDIIGTLDDNLRLSLASPCIDEGNDIYVPADIADLDWDANTSEQTPLDLDGRPKFVDGDCNDTVIVDMGAYEFSWAYIGDFDSQCDVDFFDFAILASYWQQNAPLVDIDPPPAGDDIIDIRDLAVMCENWLAGTGS